MFRAGLEFGELEGHLLVFVKALYGLRSNGAWWHNRLFGALSKDGISALESRWTHMDVRKG